MGRIVIGVRTSVFRKVAEAANVSGRRHGEPGD
jgi:hypothetical protein